MEDLMKTVYVILWLILKMIFKVISPNLLRDYQEDHYVLSVKTQKPEDVQKWGCKICIKQLNYCNI